MGVRSPCKNNSYCFQEGPKTTTQANQNTKTTTSSRSSNQLTTAVPSNFQSQITSTSFSTQTVLTDQPKVDLTISLFKLAPEKELIDPTNGYVTLALALPQATSLSNFTVRFALFVGTSPLSIDIFNISTLSGISTSNPRYFFYTNQLGNEVAGKNMTVSVEVLALNPGRFDRSSASSVILLRFGAPPKGGKCAVPLKAPEGIAWQTQFNISCTGWTSPTEPDGLTYSIYAVPFKSINELLILKSNPSFISSELSLWPIKVGIAMESSMQITLPTGWKECNYTVGIIIELSTATAIKALTFVGTFKIWPFDLSILNPIAQNSSQIGLQLSDKLKNASTDETLELAQVWSSALSLIEDTNQKTDICNNLVQSVANTFSIQPASNASDFMDITKIQQAASTVGALLTQSQVQISTDTQSAAVVMLSQVAQVYLNQKDAVPINQVQVLAQSFDAIMKSNLQGRSVQFLPTDDISPPPASNGSIIMPTPAPPSSIPTQEQQDRDRQITAQFIRGVQAITAVIAASMAINQPPVMLQTDTFESIAQKTDLNSLSSVMKGDFPVVSNLGSAVKDYDFSTANPLLKSSFQTNPIVLTKFTSFSTDPFSGLSSDS